jgi:hypothetical protein
MDLNFGHVHRVDSTKPSISSKEMLLIDCLIIMIGPGGSI